LGDDRVQAVTAHPVVIAHRGASGYLPEHTREAKALAYGQGADYLEQDVVATRDGELVVLHDVYLDRVTDVAERFPERRRDDGRFYVIDFDLAELRELSIRERRGPDGRPLYPERFADDALRFRVVTLDEEIRLVQGLNRTTGRRVGLYPEIKEPAWHARHGVDLARLVLEKLAAHGYTEPGDPAYVQCFDWPTLVRARETLGSRLPLVLLLEEEAGEAVADAGRLAELAAVVQGLGPAYRLVADAPDGGSPEPTTFARRARDAGLLLHPWTFRREALPPWAPTLEALLATFLGTVGVDGVFCDQPDVAVAVRDAHAKRQR